MGQFRDINGIRLSGNHQAHLALAVNQQPNLAIEAARKERQFTRLVQCINSVIGKAPVVQALESFQLAGLEALEVAGGGRNGNLLQGRR